MPEFKPPSATATASAGAPVLAIGPTPSSTNERVSGLPLPFPSILANVERLGPPRLSLSARKVLGL